MHQAAVSSLPRHRGDHDGPCGRVRAARVCACRRQYEQDAADAAPAEEDAGAGAAQERVRSLYARQLAVPLAGGPETLEAYKAWEAALGRVSPPGGGGMTS